MTWDSSVLGVCPWPTLIVAPTTLSLFAFAFAVACLAAFDIPLPRGDVVGVSVALDAVTFVLFGPGAALTVAAIGLCAAYVARERSVTSWNMITALVTRAVGLALASLLTAAIVMLGLAPLLGPWATAGLATMCYFLTESFAGQVASAFRTKRALSGLLRGNLRRQVPVLAAEMSAALLAVVVYGSMAVWSLLLVVALLLLIRQSYALLLGIADTYQTTVEVLVAAAEGVESGLKGHAERTAYIARELAAACRLGAQEVERVSYAALLHDLDTLSATRDPLNKRTPASAVLSEVRFFAPVVEILRLCEEESDQQDSSNEADQTSALIVALASDIDAVEHPQVHLDGGRSLVSRVAARVDRRVKARVIAAALRLGYPVPAVP